MTLFRSFAALCCAFFITATASGASQSAAKPPEPTEISPTTSKLRTESPSIFARSCNALERFFTAAKRVVSNVVEKSTSRPLQLLFIFLLGLLMSLTPCIYPMIPITLGILQTTASTSLSRNFLMAGSYTLGIATTFACIGLIAALGGAQFGALLGNPIFIIFLVLFLGYLALSMLGLYDMYIPKFMRGGNTAGASGSLLSAFAFGAISGSVASPCLSPGLLLLIGIVLALKSAVLGFFFLFVFGLGLGFPLLMLGTFSGALTMIPRSGYWMIEVKKIFGLMLLSMCLYYLNNILPWHLILWITGVLCIIIGIFYLSNLRNHSKMLFAYRGIVGVILMLGGLFAFWQAYVETLNHRNGKLAVSFTSLSYTDARAQALREQKLLLLEFGAQWCTSCKELKHAIFENETVRTSLPQIIFVEIDCTNPQGGLCAELQKKFEVKGYPTLLLVAPTDERILGRWGSSLLGDTPEQFVKLIGTYF